MTKKKVILAIILLSILALVLIVFVLKINGSINEELSGEYAENGLDGSEYKETEEETSKTMLYILSKCINDNIKQDYYYIKEIYKINKEEGSIYFIYGSQAKGSKYYIVYLDYINCTYEVEEADKKEYDNIKKGKVEQKYKDKKEISQGDNNTFEFISITDKDIAEQYVGIIKNLINFQIEELYNILDTEYKENNFSNLEEFKKFINKNKEKFDNIELGYIQKNETENYLQYVCTSITGEIYIINEKTTKDYSIILDEFEH